MTLATLDAIPAATHAGDLLTWKADPGEFDPASDTCKTDFVLEVTGTLVSVTGTDNGSTYLFETASLSTAGVWHWRRYIEDGADLLTQDYGIITVRAIPTAATDPRSTVKKTLDALDAVLENKATQDQLSYSINGRSIQRLSPKELTEWHSHYVALYNKETGKANKTGGRTSGVVRARLWK